MKVFIKLLLCFMLFPLLILLNYLSFFLGHFWNECPTFCSCIFKLGSKILFPYITLDYPDFDLNH